MKNISKLLIFIDRDSPPVNNYTYKIINDKMQIFNLKCKTHEDGREGEPQTVIVCGKLNEKPCEIFIQLKIHFLDVSLKENITFEEIYSIIIQINDTSMLLRSQPSDVSTFFIIIST